MLSASMYLTLSLLRIAKTKISKQEFKLFIMAFFIEVHLECFHKMRLDTNSPQTQSWNTYIHRIHIMSP